MKFLRWYWKNIINTQETKDLLCALGIFIFWATIFVLIGLFFSLSKKEICTLFLISFVTSIFSILVVWIPYKEYRGE